MARITEGTAVPTEVTVVPTQPEEDKARPTTEGFGVPAEADIPPEEKIRPTTEGIGVPAVVVEETTTTPTVRTIGGIGVPAAADVPVEDKERPTTEGIGVPAEADIPPEEKIRPTTEGIGVPSVVSPLVDLPPIQPLANLNKYITPELIAGDPRLRLSPLAQLEYLISIGAPLELIIALTEFINDLYADSTPNQGPIYKGILIGPLDVDQYNDAFNAVLRRVGDYNALVKEISQYDTIRDALNAGITKKQLKALGFTDAQIEVGLYPNLLMAIEAGISEDTLIAAGYTAKDIKQAKSYTGALEEIEPYSKTVDGNIVYDLVAAILAGISGDTLSVVFAAEDVNRANAYVASMANLENYTNPDGTIEILKALDAGLEADLLAVGLSTDVVDGAKLQLAAMQELSQYQVTNSPKSGLPYPAGPATNIVAALLDKVPVATLLQAGFTQEAIDEAKAQMPEGEPSWDWFKANYAADGIKGEVFPEYVERYGLDAFVKSGFTNFAAFLFPPARALKPEVKLEDISGAEWAWGAVNAALLAAPLLGKLISGIKITSIKIPLKASQVGDPTAGQVVWKGLSVVNRPVFGKSVGRWGFGSRHITLPEAKLILARAGKEAKGYRPTTALETNIYANPSRLKAMGLTDAQITKIMETFKSAKGFAGKKSPYTPKDVTAEGIKSLSAKGVRAVIKMAVKNKKRVKQVYGSSTMKVQLDPKLAKWRKPGDIDIMTDFTELELRNFAKALANDLKLTEGAKNVRIGRKSPYIVETKTKGVWHHAVDLHSKNVKYAGEVVPEAAFGLKFEGPRITVNYPGIGKVDIMSLSETGIRKLETIVGLKGGAIGPAEHRIKDIADFYVILRTLKGERIANAWARAYGANINELMNLAAKSPIDVAGWVFTPTTAARASIGAVPKIILRPPSALIRSISPSLRAAIEKPISPSLASTKIISRSASPSISPSGKLSPSVSPSVGRSPYASTYPSSMGGGTAPSTLTSIRPSKKPSVSAKVSVRPSPRVSVAPSRAPSPRISPVPSPSPAPSPSLAPSPTLAPAPLPLPLLPPLPIPTSIVVSPTGPKRAIIPPIEVATKKKKKVGVGGEITWRQGQILQGKVLKNVWWVIKDPYRTNADVRRQFIKPKGAHEVSGVGSAYKTIQLLMGKPPDKLFLDMGIMDIQITRPSRAGQPGAIKYKPDVKQRTRGDIVLKRVR